MDVLMSYSLITASGYRQKYFKDIVGIEENGNEIWIETKNKNTRFYLPFYNNLLFIFIKDDTLCRVIEYADGDYSDRKPDFRDYIIANSVVKERVERI